MLGLPSNGLHTNGYSLARKLLFEVAKYSPETYVNEIKNKVGNELMRTHKSYWPALKKMIDARCRLRHGAHHRRRHHRESAARAAARHGGGHRTGNLAGAADLRAPAELGNVPQDEMLRTFNMGMGMLLVVHPRNSRKPKPCWSAPAKSTSHVGRIVKGERKVMYS